MGSWRQVPIQDSFPFVEVVRSNYGLRASEAQCCCLCCPISALHVRQQMFQKYCRQLADPDIEDILIRVIGAMI